MFDHPKKYYSGSRLKLIPDIITRWETIVVLIIAALLFGFLIWWLNHIPSIQNSWETFAVDKKVPASFCEQLHLSNPVRQPVNTFSNIVYLAVAIIVLKKTRESYISSSNYRITADNGYALLFGVLLLYVFGASAFYHASLIDAAHKLDYSAVFSFSLFPIMFLLNRWWLRRDGMLLNIQKRKTTAVFFSAFLAVNLLLIFLTPKGKESLAAIILVMIFLGLAIATVIFEKENPGLNYLILSFSCLLIAILWFELDKYKILCNPASYFQPHSLWNVFVSISAFYFYLYIRVESNPGALIYKMK